MARPNFRWLAPIGILLTAGLSAVCSEPKGVGGGTASQSSDGTKGSNSLMPDDGGRISSAEAGQSGQTVPPTKESNCGSHSEIQRSGADVLLVLDKSDSMGRRAGNRGSSTTRYEDVVSALDQVLPATADSVSWGLELFPHSTDNCAPGEIDVPIAPNNAKAMADAYSPSVVTPSGNTPTTASIQSAVAALQAMTDTKPKYIVLATDGEPNCDSGSGSAVDNAVAAIRASNDVGIPVFVIGLSSDASADTLNKMAVAGGKPASDPNDPSTKYYQADTSEKLVAAMNDIAKQLATCRFNLPEPPPDPNNVLVTYDDGHSASASSTTWGYADSSNTAIVLYGDDCRKLMDETYKNVQVLYGCPANCGAQQKNDTNRTTADVLLVLDTSGSMSSRTRDDVTGTSSTRYKGVVSALDRVLPATDGAINWGLEMYPGAAGQCTPGDINVPIKPNNASTIVAAIDPAKVSPSGNTPIAASIQNAIKGMTALADTNPKYMVLATDGAPNCSDRGTNAGDEAADALSASNAAGIPVFVISLSTEGRSADTLNKMAIAGGKPANDPSDPEAKYYKADTPDQLEAAMRTISGLVGTCQFKLTSKPPVPDNVLVIYDDGRRALASSSTWGYTDSSYTAITVFGEDCDKLRNGTYQKVQILYGCPNDMQLVP